ncbi:MAG: magnesium transporter [Candidatus Aenigmarchaeota archaeon]|nr:magnesium transporter [Candidatus Aenigmarchaeota archaeon]
MARSRRWHRRPHGSKVSSRSDFREILFAEIISVTGGLFAGFLLALTTDRFYLIPGLLILIPGFLEMRGSISGSLAARLSSGMILGATKPEFAHNRIMKGNVIAAILLALAVSLMLGVIAFGLSWLVFGKAIISIILISVLAGLLSNIIEIPVTIATTFWLFRKGYDPNNIMGPYVTTVGDIVSILSLLIAIMII